MEPYKLGQYFTEDLDLQYKVVDLCLNGGTALEPSAGEGHLVRAVEDIFSFVKAIDLDNTLSPICATNIEHMDFFDLSLVYKYDTVFGNPPFLKHRELPADIVKKMERDSILKNCNIFYNFIEKAFYHLNDGGEIVFIIPREFFNSTRAIPLRQLLYDNGTITDVVDYEERKLFKDASPSIVIIRYEKGNMSHKTRYERGTLTELRNETLVNGSYIFEGKTSATRTPLSDLFDVKVGLVTGLNKLYEKDTKLSIPTICSDYFMSHTRRNFIFADEHTLEEIKDIDEDLYNYLLDNKETLINRKIKKFREDNWWHYGAVRNLQLMREEGRCIYVNAKTRKEAPFFVEKRGYYDGSMLALYPKVDLNLAEWQNILNNSKDEFKEQGLHINNRYVFSVKTLSDFLV